MTAQTSTGRRFRPLLQWKSILPVLASVGLIASYLPARRATRIAPIVAIRED